MVNRSKIIIDCFNKLGYSFGKFAQKLPMADLCVFALDQSHVLNQLESNYSYVKLL